MPWGSEYVTHSDGMALQRAGWGQNEGIGGGDVGRGELLGGAALGYRLPPAVTSRQRTVIGRPATADRRMQSADRCEPTAVTCGLMDLPEREVLAHRHTQQQNTSGVCVCVCVCVCVISIFAPSAKIFDLRSSTLKIYAVSECCTAS